MSNISEMDAEKFHISRCFLRRNGCLIIVISALENSTTQSHFKRETFLLKSLEKTKATFICTHSFYIVFFPYQGREKDQVTLLSWAHINSCEVLSSVRKSFPGNHIYTFT